MVLAAFTKFEKVQCLVTLKVFKLVWLAFSEKKSIGFGKMTVETFWVLKYFNNQGFDTCI